MASELTISEAELLDALQTARRARGDGPSGALTAIELGVAMSCGIRAVTNTLRRFHAAGRLVVHRVERTRIDGQRCVVPAYSLAGAKPTPKKRR